MQKLYSFTKIVILVIILHVSSTSIAQSGVYTGYFINNQGDTTNGIVVPYRQWNHNPDRVLFTSFPGREKIVLTPYTCKEVHIDGYETYTAFHGERMTNPAILSQSATERDLDRYKSITTFLRQFATADSYKFYIFKDDNRSNLYYSNAGGVITELLQKVYIKDNHSIQSMTYRQQLKMLFPDRTEEIDRVFYTEESLASFLVKQNKVTIDVNKAQKNYGGLYLSGGVSLNSLKFTPNTSMDFSEKQYESRHLPLVSIGYIVPFSRNFSRVFFNPQIKITALKHTAESDYNHSYPVNLTTFQSSPVISLGFNFGYNFIDRPNIKVSVAPGAGFYYLVNFKHVEMYKSNPDYSSTVVTKMDHLKPLVDLQATVLIKNRIIIWSAYNLPTNITIYPAAKDKFASKQLGLGYKLR